jgi:hypothetical protein
MMSRVGLCCSLAPAGGSGSGQDTPGQAFVAVHLMCYAEVQMSAQRCFVCSRYLPWYGDPMYVMFVPDTWCGKW